MPLKRCMHSSQSGLFSPLNVARLLLNFSLLGLSGGRTGLWGTMSLILRPSWKITLPAVDFFFLAAGWSAISVSSRLVVDSNTPIRVLFSGNNEDFSWGCSSSTAAAPGAAPEVPTSREAAARVRVLAQALSCPSCPVIFGCWICLVFPIEQQNIQLFQKIPIFLPLSLRFFFQSKKCQLFRSRNSNKFPILISWNLTQAFSRTTHSAFSRNSDLSSIGIAFFFNRRFANISVQEISVHFLSRYLEI